MADWSISFTVCVLNDPLTDNPLCCVVIVCVGPNAGRLQTQEQQDQRRSVPLSRRHAEHVSLTFLIARAPSVWMRPSFIVLSCG